MDQEDIVYQPGDVLVGKYRVERVLGVGGFGAVLAAMHIQLEERVAIKVLLPHAAKNPAASERFLREARAAVRIRSEHVARVSDVGQLPDTTPYMVMEYLAGDDLSNIVKASGGQRVEDVAEWLLQACEALAEAHSLGIIHRDLKPANLFLTRKVDGTPCVKVLDFGISKLTNEMGDKGMTKTSDVMGSPFYMSPEQMRSTRSVDARSDIWALGAILFEMLSGAPPFDAETMTALVVSIMQEAPRDLTAYRRDIPPQLRDIVLRCLEKDPNRRFPDVASLAAALAPFAPARAQTSVQRVMAISGRHSLSQVPSSGGPVSPTVHSGPPTGMTGPTGVAATLPGHLTTESAPPPSALFQQEHSSGSAPGGYGAPQPTVPGYATGPQAPVMHPGAAKLAATAASPAQSWGGTYMGQKQAPAASKAPLVIGVVSLLVVGAGVGGFVFMKTRTDDVRDSRNNTVVVAAAGNDKSDKSDKSDTVATATADAKQVEPAATAQPSVVPTSPVSTGKPGKASATATATATTAPAPTPTHTSPPVPTPTQTHTTPPVPTPTQSSKPAYTIDKDFNRPD